MIKKKRFVADGHRGSGRGFACRVSSEGSESLRGRAGPGQGTGAIRGEILKDFLHSVPLKSGL